MTSRTEATLNSLATKDLLVLWLCLFEQQGWVVESQLLQVCHSPEEITSLRERWLAQISAALHTKHGHLSGAQKEQHQGNYLFCLLSNARTIEQRYANLLLLLANIESDPEQLQGKTIVVSQDSSNLSH